MSKLRNLFRTPAITALAFALVGMVAIASPASAAGSRQYSAAVSEAPVDATHVTVTVTILNLPGSSAVLGSANITVPTSPSGGFSGLGTPTITFSSGKVWAASQSGNMIRLRANGTLQKLSPGQWVSVSFNATKPTGPGTFVFTTGAKASSDFTGSSTFTLVGGQPALVLCPDTGECSASLGSVGDPKPDHQAGKVTIDGNCPGCILTMRETFGDFCDKNGSGTEPNPPNTPCQTHFGPLFVLDSNGNAGTLTLVIACDVTDCPAPTDAGAFAGSNSYPVFIDYNDAPGPSTPGDSIQQITQFCGDYGVIPPCLQSAGTGRFGDGNDYRSTLTLPFGVSDPRTLH
jgi:hypothetical protein